jgi:integrase
MALHIRKRGRWFHVDLFHHGLRVRRTLKTTNKESAHEMAEQLSGGLRGGIWNLPVAMKTGVRSGIERYRIDHQELHHAESTRIHTASTFGMFAEYVDEKLGHKALLDTVSLNIIEGFQKRLLKRETIRKKLMSRPAVNRAMREISAFFNWAVAHGYCRINPSTTLRSMRETKKIVIPVSIRELRQLVANLSEVLADAVRIVVSLGLRLGECLHLRPGDVSLERRLLYVQANEDYGIKDREEREIPLTTPAVRVLRRRLRAVRRVGFLFPSEEGTVIGNRNALRALQDACKAAKLRKINWQLLRKTFSTMQGKVLKPWELKAVMGHSDIRTTDRNYMLIMARECRLKAVSF